MSDLPKVKTKKRGRRVGRGYGSGKGGHTSGRGMKGQKARSKIPVLFEGMKMKKSLIKRLPFRRGKSKNKSKPGPVVVHLQALNIMRSGSKVDVESLAETGIVKLSDAKEFGVKILGSGELSKKLTVLVPTSKSVAKRIEKAGGRVENK